MNNILVMLLLFAFSTKSIGQTLVANPEKYKIAASASYFSDKYPYYGIMENIALTDLGSNVALILHSNFQRNFIKINQQGQIFNLTTNTLLGSIGGSGLIISQNEQYYYYVYSDYITSTGGIKILRQSINNGIVSSSIVFSIDPGTGLSPLAVNNNGDIAVTITYYDQNNRPISYEVARINKLGQKTVLDTIPAPADFSYVQYKTTINDQGTVFVYSSIAPYSLFSYGNNGIKTEIDQGVVGTFHNSVQTAEDKVYYLKNNKIYVSPGKKVVFDPYVAVPLGSYSNFGMSGFFITPNDNIYYFANCYDSNYKQETCLIKNYEVLLATGQKLDSRNINNLHGLKGNSNENISFIIDERPLGTNGYQHLINYSGEPKKKYKLKKTISILRNNIPTPVGNPDHFQMIPTVDTRGTHCAQRYSPSRIRITVECQNNEAPFENIDGCKIQMQKELGANLGGHFEVSHDMADRPLGHFLNSQIEQQFIAIPIGGLSFTYEAPEPSGEIDLNFVAFGPDNKGIEVAKSVAQVKIGNLVSLADVPYLTMRDTGHLTEDETEQGGVYSTSVFRTKLNDALDLYYERSLAAEIPEHEIVLLTSEAASLVWGGLYDIDHDWNPSHCGHRIGNSIDLGMAAFRLSTSPRRGEMRELLRSALLRNNLNFPIPSESPSSRNHWHTQSN